MEFLIVFVVVLVIILFVLLSISKKLSQMIEHSSNRAKEEEHLIDIKEILSDIKITLDEIKYTTDLIEQYKIPTPNERKAIDQYRIDLEIDEMLSIKPKVTPSPRTQALKHQSISNIYKNKIPLLSITYNLFTTKYKLGY